MTAESAVQEQVLDVLDYLLELDEVDEQTYRRMSSTNFSAKTLKRLSMTMVGPPPVVTPAPTAETAMEITTDADASPSEEQECRSDAARCSTSVAMEVAYPAAEEDCVIGELDVLIALRSYLAALNKPVEAQEAPIATVTETPAESAPAVPEEAPTAALEISTTEEAATTPVTPEDAVEQSKLSCASTRSSTSSAGTFEGKTEWRDSLVPTERRTSCTTTMRVSFCNAPRLSTVPSSASTVTSAPAAEVEMAATAVTESAPAPAPAKAKGVVTYPLRELLDDALQRGLVVADVTGRMELGTHTKYTVQTQVGTVFGLFHSCVVNSAWLRLE
jgi:hypothetical protein